MPSAQGTRSTLLHLLILWNLATTSAQDPEAIRACLDSCRTAELAGDMQQALLHADRAAKLSMAAGDSLQWGAALVRRSELEQNRGDYTAALRVLYDALRIYDALRDANGLAQVYNNIGSIHHYDKNLPTAGDYYARSLAIRETNGTPRQLALAYNNLGTLLQDEGLPDSALYYHRLGLAIRRAEGDSSWLAVTYTHIGVCHDALDRTDSALTYLHRALDLLGNGPHNALRAHVQTRLGLAALRGGDVRAALRWCRAATTTANALRSLPLLEKCYDCLHRAYDRSGQPAQALNMLRQHLALRDSMLGQERSKELTRMELNHAFERQRLTDSLGVQAERRRADLAYQAGLARERDQKRLFLFAGIGVLFLAGGLWNRLRFVRRARNVLEHERQRSEKLLLNILPKPIADELKLHGRAQAREVAGVSILFTDFHAFTQFSEQFGPAELVAEIDACFRAFDAICTTHGVEKIKTIGDAYMGAGGLPAPSEGSALRTVHAALDMQQWMLRRSVERTAKGLPAFRMRAGIHTGPVVAGVVGDTKFQYDVWGDTVNTASRMESSGEVGQVNISEATYELVKNEPGLMFTPRGKVQAKGKGEMEMYFVERNHGDG